MSASVIPLCEFVRSFVPIAVMHTEACHPSTAQTIYHAIEALRIAGCNGHAREVNEIMNHVRDVVSRERELMELTTDAVPLDAQPHEARP